ncbi:Ig-like domain-containing protein [Microvirga lotononidis]|uniref:Ig-like domain-containing protein n=1 Tax=Microvirga lotononidis TaxID=864069 RepID=UPI002AF6BD88|nr:Ig-like domain-containing protein [Microvirga lotononidis]WQO26635.1 Ig-like domain-containing protein [Microvirga lotononidis]
MVNGTYSFEPGSGTLTGFDWVSKTGSYVLNSAASVRLVFETESGVLTEPVYFDNVPMGKGLPLGTNVPETSLRIHATDSANGLQPHTFDLRSLYLFNPNPGTTQILRITADNGSYQTVNLLDEGAFVTFFGSGFLGIRSFTITADTDITPNNATPGEFCGLVDNIVLENIQPADVTGPSIISVTVPATKTYASGQALMFTVNFNEAATVDVTGGHPRIQLTIGSQTVYADYVSGSGTSALTFRYTVLPGQVDVDGIMIGSLQLNGGTIKDAAGNNASTTLTNVGSTANVLVDGVAPTVTISSSAQSLKAGETATITFTFSEDPGGSFTGADITVSGGTLSGLSGSGTVRTATFTPNTNTNNGPASITVAAGSYADAAGNLGGAGASPSIIVDTSPPTVSITCDKPFLKAGETATITFTFSEDPGSSFSWDGSSGDIVVVGGTLSAISGTGTTRTAIFTPAAYTNNGSASISVQGAGYQDAAGNTGSDASLSFAFDTLAPSTPGAPALAAGDDTGASNRDQITNKNVLTFTGSAEDGTTVRLYAGVVEIGHVTATGGTYSIAAAGLAEGTHTIIAVAIDANGNTSTASGALVITIDRTAPTGVASAAFSNDSGSSNTDFVTNHAMQTISGTLDAATENGDTVLVSLDNGQSWVHATHAVGTMSWSLSGVMLTGSGTLLVKVEDMAGNSGNVFSHAYVLDTTSPSITVGALMLSSDTGASDSDFVTTVADQTVTATLSSALAAGDTLYGSVDGGRHWTDITAMVNGTSIVWTGVTLEAGSNALHFKVVDLAGNQGGTTVRSYTLDTGTPTAPRLSLAHDSGIDGDGLTNSGVVIVSGLESDAAWQYTTDNGHSWTTGTGNSLTLIGDGAHQVQVRQTSQAGNVSLVSDALSFTLDSQAPTVAIALSSTQLALGQSAVVTFTFSEVPVGFSIADVTVENGTLSALTASGTDPRVYTAILTPNGNQATSHNLITVGTGWSDAAGNAPVAGTASLPYSVDTRQTDGLNVVVSPITYPDGSTGRTLTIPVVTSGRVDTDGTAGLADIPLVTSGGQTVLLAQLPVGYGLQVSGPAAPKTAGTSLSDLIREIQAHTPAGSPDQGQLAGGGAGFLGLLPGDRPLIVQTITPTMLPGSLSAPGQPLLISGTPAAPGLPQTALVIDTSGLPPGTHLQLDNVDFAAVIGAVTITGGAGAQVVFGDSANQHIVLGADDDTLHGGGGDDYIGSHGGNDWLYGDAGNDTVSGGEGNDWLFGGSGHDWLYGGTGHDRLEGGAGNDHLLGESGNDTLLGGEGNDRLAGGLGRDTMWGGAGKDVFVFSAVKDSKVGSQRDVIADFQSGRDRIDLRDIDANTLRKGNQKFVWAGADGPFLLAQESAHVLKAGFTGKAGELRFDRGILMGDVNGDGRADFEIKIVGKFAFGDVIL